MLSTRGLVAQNHKALLPFDFESTTAMVAADNDFELRFLRRAMKSAGYEVLSSKVGVQLTRELRRRIGKTLKHNPVELLVLRTAHRPWVAVALLEVIRESYATLPIILIIDGAPELESEARRLAVDVVLDAPVTAEQLWRAARDLAPLESHAAFAWAREAKPQ